MGKKIKKEAEPPPKEVVSFWFEYRSSTLTTSLKNESFKQFGTYPYIQEYTVAEVQSLTNDKIS